MSVRVEQSGNVNLFSNGTLAGKAESDPSAIEVFKSKGAENVDGFVKNPDDPVKSIINDMIKDMLRTQPIDKEMYASATGIHPEELDEEYAAMSKKFKDLQANPEKLEELLKKDDFAEILNRYSDLSEQVHENPSVSADWTACYKEMIDYLLNN